MNTPPDFSDEPDAYLYKTGGPWDIAISRQECTYNGAPAARIVPVWFVPREWKAAQFGGLTDAQIIEACQSIYLSDYPQGSRAYDIAIARAVLARALLTANKQTD